MAVSKTHLGNRGAKFKIMFCTGRSRECIAPRFGLKEGFQCTLPDVVHARFQRVLKW